MTPDVFISYSSVDKPFADAVCERLEANGFGCWIAPRNIVPGQEWSEAIIDGINGSRAVVLIFSSHSNASPQVLREVERTVNKRIPLVPFRVENVPLSKAMEYFISVPHWLEAHTAPLEPHLEELVRTVRHLIPREDGEPAASVSVIPAPVSSRPALHHFPAHVTDFVGREKEVEAVHDILNGGARLVTLTGMGGSGKTRIAYRIATERIEQYLGGAWWVDLSALHDPSLVLQTLADTFEVKGDPSVPLLKQLAARLQGEKTLLILDNFEQVAGAANEIGELTRACPTLTVMITSREVLNLSFEHEYYIPPMPVEEAVQLFVARAQQAKGGFSLDDASRPIAESICRKLDGIPLAVELAAAQVRLLKVAQIEKQLSQRFKTLVSRAGDVSQRQKTLRAAVDWSYDLLTEEEKQLFASLSIFHGSFSLEAVDTVCMPDDAYGGLMRLREKSLVTIDDTLEVARFSMLETLHDYGVEKLQEMGLTEELAERHARYFLEFVKERGPQVWKPDAGEAIAELATDTDDIRAAWEWLYLQPDADDVAAMTVGILDFWDIRGHVREGKERLLRCLSREQEITDLNNLGFLLNFAGWFAYLQADFSAATENTQRALNLLLQSGDRNRQSEALNILALTSQAQGRMDEAAQYFEQSLELARALGDVRKQAVRLSNMSILATRKGQLEQAREYLKEARTLFQRLQDSFGTAACLSNLSDLALQQEDWQEAQEYARQGLELFRTLENPQGIALSLTNMALAATRQGDADAARPQLREALTLCVETGAHWLVPILLELYAETLAAGNEDRAGLFCLLAASHLRAEMCAPRTPEEQAYLQPLEDRLASSVGESASSTLRIGFTARTLESIVDGVLHPEGQMRA